jgi:hypothetical protein
MRRRSLGVAVAALAALAMAAPAQGAGKLAPFNEYTVDGPSQLMEDLGAQGYDVLEGGSNPGGGSGSSRRRRMPSSSATRA